MFAGLNILDEVRAVGEAKDIGVYEIHRCGEIELVDFDCYFRGSQGVEEREVAVEDESLSDEVQFGRGLQL